MSQLQMAFETDDYGPWIITTRGDRDCARLFDRHYSRQTPGSPHFTRPGKTLILRTADGRAMWVSYESRYRTDGLDCWENTCFRNESSYLSSDLVKWAVYATLCEWGALMPKDGFITYVQDNKIKSQNPGACYKQAGFEHVGQSKVRKLSLLQLQMNGYVKICQEISLVKSLKAYQDMVLLAYECGEIHEAMDLYRDARKIEQQLLSTRHARKRQRDGKWLVFKENDDEDDFLLQFSDDGWVPFDMLEYLME